MATTSPSSKRTNLRRLTPKAGEPRGSALRSLSASEVQRLRRILSQPAECVLDESFRRKGDCRDHLAWFEAHVPLAAAANYAGRRERLTRALSAEAERELFLRFNYFRYRLMVTLKRLGNGRLSLTAARHLLRLDRGIGELRETIVEANLGLVLTMVQRARLGSADFTEVISEGHMALLRSIDRFDCSRGFKFSTYACRSIVTAITRAVAMMARHRAFFPTEYDPKYQKSDFLESRRATFEEDCLEVLDSALRENKAELTRTERKILSERFGLKRGRNDAEAAGKTLREVAEVFGVTKERVRQIQNRALAKLRDVIDERVFNVSALPPGLVPDADE